MHGCRSEISIRLKFPLCPRFDTPKMQRRNDSNLNFPVYPAHHRLLHSKFYPSFSSGGIITPCTQLCTYQEQHAVLKMHCTIKSMNRGASRAEQNKAGISVPKYRFLLGIWYYRYYRTYICS